MGIKRTLQLNLRVHYSKKLPSIRGSLQEIYLAYAAAFT